VEQQLQIIAWGLWAWVGISTLLAAVSAYGGLFSDAAFDTNMRTATALSLNAILGLMLIQTLGLTV
jgi:hypothetical protein